MKKISRIFLGALTLTSLLVSCGGKKDAGKAGAEQQQAEALFAVNTMKIKRSNISDYIKLTGS